MFHIKKLSCSFFFLLLLSQIQCTCQGTKPEQAPKNTLKSFYALEDIPTFSITLSSRALKRLDKDPRKYVSGDFFYHNTLYSNVGIRLKGHRSLRTMEEKPSFKVRFDKYEKNKNFLGLTKLTLNNMVEDPTMIREILGYRLHRAMNVPAPKVGYAKVYVNEDFYGLYALIETVDDAFLARNFQDPSGELYEGEYGCDLFVDDVPGFEKDAGKDKSRSFLHAFAQKVQKQASELFYASDAPLEMQSFLAYLAVSAFISDFDGYRHGHNYRLYREPASQKWFFIPWGLDRVFKRRISIYDSEGLLAKKCFQNAKCRLDYIRTLQKTIEHFETLRFTEGAKALLAFLQESKENDPRKPYDAKKITSSQRDLFEFLETRVKEVEEETSCLQNGQEIDQDGDGYGCMDCNDNDPDIHPDAIEQCDNIDNNCSSLIDDNPSCPCHEEEIDGVRFFFCDLPMPFEEAANFCKAQGKILAFIDTEEQSEQLFNTAEDIRDERWWIGANDREIEDRFVWQDGTPLSFSNWSRGEPDNDACNQDCVALKQGADGRWHDTHCGQHRSFICRDLP